MKNKIFSGSFLFLAACSPLKSSPHDEKHQLELTLHEVQTNLDDLRHDMHCFRADLEILDGRIQGFEHAISTLKKEDMEKQAMRLEHLNAGISQLEKRVNLVETADHQSKERLKQLALYAEEASSALKQYKDRIHEIEKELAAEQKKMAKKPIATKSYRVKAGDSLQKIAKLHNTTIDAIKQLNSLNQDLIVVDQELKLPSE